MKNKNLLLFSKFLFVFSLSQFYKPDIFMEVYRFVFNFNPTLYDNWELYKMVWSNIKSSSMSLKVSVPLAIAEVLWLLLPIYFYRRLMLKVDVISDDLEQVYNFFDVANIFDPSKSLAKHIVNVKSIEHGEKLGEFFLNQGIIVEVLSIEAHGGQLLKLMQYEHVAYAKTTNLSLDNKQRLIEASHQNEITDKPIWDMEIAFNEKSRGFYTNVINALIEMRKFYPSKDFFYIKVRPYQSLNALVSHNHILHLPGNKKLVSIAYYAGELEIETEHIYLDTKQNYKRTTTVWLSPSMDLCSESKGINEDFTVSTNDVNLNYIDLPYSNSVLRSIEVQEITEESACKTVLLLKVCNSLNLSSENYSEILIAINMFSSSVQVDYGANDSFKKMSVGSYRNQKCILYYA